MNHAREVIKAKLNDLGVQRFDNAYKGLTEICKENPDLTFSYVKKMYYETIKDVKTESIDTPVIVGIKAEKHVDFEKDVLPSLIQIGQRAAVKNETEKIASITMPDRPFSIAMISDLHGGGKIDYEQATADVNLIKDTPDMYAILAGDLTDNFIFSKLIHVLMHQPTNIDNEHLFLDWFIEKIKSKLIAFVSGNHDNWTKKAGAIDYLRILLKDVPCLFDNNQVEFTLNWGEFSQKWLVRHKWRGNSIFNPTHAQEVAWERIGIDFDICVGGHTHIATLCRPFIKHDKVRYAVLLGTYKLRDEYGVECGFARTYSGTTGSGAFVFNTNGRYQWFDDLYNARDFLYTLKMKQR